MSSYAHRSTAFRLPSASQPTATDWLRQIPWTLPLVSLGLMLLGLAGIARGDTLSQAGEFFGRQIVWISLAVGAMALATMLPYRVLRHYSYLLFTGSLLLLIAVYVFPPRWGSRRWIPLGLLYFQPSELAKIAYILMLARYLMYRENYRYLSGLLVPFILTLIPVGLILKEPDLGTSMLFIPVLFSMLFAAGARLRHLVLIIVLGAAMLPILWMGMSAEQQSRITALFLQKDGGPAPPGDGYHLHQSKQVLALGGTWGSELTGQTVDEPMAYYLPACRTDFVLCMVGERFGLAGTLAVLLLYLLLFWRGLAVASSTREPFGRLIAVGVTALLAGQMVVNAGMTVGLMPVTGVTLPLMSYGGSSLLFTTLALGLVMNIAMRPGYEIAHEPFRFGTSRRS